MNEVTKFLKVGMFCAAAGCFALNANALDKTSALQDATEAEGGDEAVETAEPLDADILQFSLDGYNNVKINRKAMTIAVNVDFGTNLKAMVADFQLRDGLTAFINDTPLVSGVTAIDYSRPVVLRLVEEPIVEEPSGDETGNEPGEEPGEEPSGDEPSGENLVAENEGETPEPIVTEFVLGICYGELPIVYISTEDDQPIDSKEEYRSIPATYILNSDFDAVYANAKIKGRGNTSWTMPKKSYTFKLNKKDKFAGLKKHKTFAFVANYCDKTLLRNNSAYELGRKVFTNMAWAPSTVPVNLVVNGEFMGLYSITETNKIDGNRIDIPSMEDCPSLEEAPNYGFLVEMNFRHDEVFNFQAIRTKTWMSLKEPDGADISEELQAYIEQKVNDWEIALYNKEYTLPESQYFYRNYFDIPSLIDWMLVNEITKNNDAACQASVFFYYDPADAMFHMGPLWDFDIPCGNINYQDCVEPEGLHLTNRWFTRLLADEQFMKEYKKRYWETRDEVVKYFNKTLQKRADALAVDAEFNFQRWPILGKYIWPNADGYADRTTYQSEIDFMVDWVNRRIAWLDEEFYIEQETSHVDIATEHQESEAVYYTIDGRRVNGANLGSGLYIKHTDAGNTKVLVK